MQESVWQTAKNMAKEAWQELGQTTRDLWSILPELREPIKTWFKENGRLLLVFGVSAFALWFVVESLILVKETFESIFYPKRYSAPTKISEQPQARSKIIRREEMWEKYRQAEPQIDSQPAQLDFDQLPDYEPPAEDEAYPGEPPTAEEPTDSQSGLITSLPGVSHSVLIDVDTVAYQDTIVINAPVRVSHYGPTGNNMANGQPPHRGATSVSDRNIPFGSIIVLTDNQGKKHELVVKDRTASWVHEKFAPLTTIDVFRSSRSDPMFPREQEAEIRICAKDLKAHLAKRNRLAQK